MLGKQRPDPSKCPEIAKGRIEFTASITQAPNASKTLRAGSSLRPQSPRPPTQRPDPSKYRENKGRTPPNTPKSKGGPLQMFRKQKPDTKCRENAKGRVEFTASITQASNASITLRAGSSLRPQSPKPPTQRPDPSKYREIKGWTPPNTPKTKAGPLQMFQKQSSDPSKCPIHVPHTFTTSIRVP